MEARVSPEQRQRIQRASELAGQSVSSFVVDAAVERAEQVIAARAVTLVPADYFDHLVATLDAVERAPNLARAAERARRHPRIRLHHGMTLQQFAEEFGVTHQAVMKWERSEDESTRMNWSTEKDIRLWQMARMDGEGVDARLGKLYRKLKQDIARRATPLNETTAFSCRGRSVVPVTA